MSEGVNPELEGVNLGNLVKNRKEMSEKELMKWAKLLESEKENTFKELEDMRNGVVKGTLENEVNVMKKDFEMSFAWQILTHELLLRMGREEYAELLKSEIKKTYVEQLQRICVADKYAGGDGKWTPMVKIPSDW